METIYVQSFTGNEYKNIPKDFQMLDFSLSGEITEYFLFHEGNTMFYLCMRHFFFPVGETKEEEKKTKEQGRG